MGHNRGEKGRKGKKDTKSGEDNFENAILENSGGLESWKDVHASWVPALSIKKEKKGRLREEKGGQKGKKIVRLRARPCSNV